MVKDTTSKTLCRVARTQAYPGSGIIVGLFNMTRPEIKEEVPAYVDHQVDCLFDTIESAHQYVQLLGEVVSDVRRELEDQANCEQRSPVPRRLDAVRLALYNLDKLHLHMKTASRILNDLRSLRRLLLEERKGSMKAA